MLYIEKECNKPELGIYLSFSTDVLSRKDQTWLIPCRILDISPAEYVKLLVNTYNTTLHCNSGATFIGRYWKNQVDERKWRNFINKKAREKGFQV